MNWIVEAIVYMLVALAVVFCVSWLLEHFNIDC